MTLTAYDAWLTTPPDYYREPIETDPATHVEAIEAMADAVIEIGRPRAIDGWLELELRERWTLRWDGDVVAQMSDDDCPEPRAVALGLVAAWSGEKTMERRVAREERA